MKLNTSKLLKELQAQKRKADSEASKNMKTVVREEAKSDFETLKSRVGSHRDNKFASEMADTFKKDVLNIIDTVEEREPVVGGSFGNKMYQIVIPIQLVVRDLLNQARRTNMQYTDLLHLLELAPSPEDLKIISEELQTVLKKRRSYKIVLKGILTKQEYVQFYEYGFIDSKSVCSFAYGAHALEDAINVKLFGWSSDSEMIEQKIKVEYNTYLERFKVLETILDSQAFYTLRTTSDMYNGPEPTVKELLDDRLDFDTKFPSVITREQHEKYFKNVEGIVD